MKQFEIKPVIAYLLLIVLVLMLGYFTHHFETGKVFVSADYLNGMAKAPWLRDSFLGGRGTYQPGQPIPAECEIIFQIGGF